MNRLARLLLISLSIVLVLPVAAIAGHVEDIQAKLNESRQQTMAMLSERDKSVLAMRYEEALASSKEVDARLQRALDDPTQKAIHAPLAEFKQVWEVFKTTRDQQIVPLLMSGKQDQARMMAKKEQMPRFKRMNELLDSIRTK